MIKKFSLEQKTLPPPEKRAGVVYCIPCSDCPQIYVGETRQLLSARLCQHKNDERNQNDHTALAVHSKECVHKFNFNCSKILADESNDKKRKIREVVEIIKRNGTAVNYKSDTVNFASLYAPTIASICK